MMGRGFVHLIALVAGAIILSLGGIGFVASQRTSALEGRILSSSNSNSSGNSNSGSNKGQEISSGKKENSSTNSQSTNSNSTSQSQSQSSSSKKSEPKLKADIEIEIETIEEDSEVEVEIEVEEEESSPSASPTITPGRKVRSNFPITVNPQTGEKTVTTPSGTHTVILPDVAIQNMIKAGFPVVLTPEPSPEPSSSPEGTPSATPEGTPSSSPEVTTTEEGGILLTELNNQLVYEIPAIKKQKFLGAFPVDVKVTGYVSAENGDIVTIKKSFFDTIVDILSF